MMPMARTVACGPTTILACGGNNIMVREIFSAYMGDGIAVREFAGLSTDDKPTSGVGTGSTFWEVDTGKVSGFNEDTGTWVEQFSFQ